MKSAILASAALAFGTLGLAACSDEQPAASDESDTAQDGITVNEARLILPAVKGNPGAAYFTVKNDGDRDRFIRAAAIEGAQSAVLHQMGTWNRQPSMDEVMQIAVPAGGELVFEPGGLHVMANDLADTVAAGGQAEITLTFVGGKTATFPAEVRAAGDDR